MARAKAAVSKKVPPPDVDTATEEARDEIVDSMLTKGKKALEVEDPEIFPAALVDEKVEEDPLLEADTDELEDELGIDDDEIDPFKDKWEE